MAEALESAAVVMVVLPTVYHGSVAKTMAPHLRSGQVVVLNPGATGGALEVRTVLQEEGCRVRVTVAETDTLLYACRSPQPGEAIIHGIKGHVDVAALPAGESRGVAATHNTAFPQFAPASSVLQTSLTNKTLAIPGLATSFNRGQQVQLIKRDVLSVIEKAGFRVLSYQMSAPAEPKPAASAPASSNACSRPPRSVTGR